MKYIPCKPKIMLSRDNLADRNSKKHFHIVVGKTKNGENGSVSITHSSRVLGLKTLKLPDNIEKSYAVTTAYVRDAKEYVVPKYVQDYEISSEDLILAVDIVNKIKVPLH